MQQPAPREKKFNWKLIIVVALVLIGILIAVLLLRGRGPSTDPAKTLRFAQIPITYSAVTFIAEANGYLKEEGLDYSSISVPAGPDVVTALKGTGQNAAGAGAIAITPVITMIGASDHPVIVATTLTSNRQVKLVTFSQTGITEDPATLKGKRIGVTKNTNGDIYLSRLLRKGGLRAEDATLVNGRPSDLRGLLIRGEIDAAILWDPFVVQAIREYRSQVEGRKITSRGEPEMFVDPTLATLAFNIVTTEDKLANNREQLIRMLRALIKAEEFMRQHPKDAQALLEKWLNLQSGDLDDFFSTTEFHIYLDSAQTKQWMKEELAWLRENRPDAKVPDDLSSFVDTSLLKSVDASRVKE
jgi:NitT/TauT family transport system substrate-binding protein